jgi:DNA-directed RNA polymerase specialized sigma24 family protein
MPHEVPAEPAALLAARDRPGQEEAAWGAFVRAHTRLLLHVARAFGGDYDAVMDRYAFILEKLRADDYRRLRSWAADRRSKLTTWLVIVA